MKKRKILKPSFNEEIKLWKKGFEFVAGFDEVGRGSFAGPLVAASVIFPKGIKLKAKINDSKLLSSKKREALVKVIKNKAHTVLTCEISVPVINKIGINKANKKAFRILCKMLYTKLDKKPFFALIDGFQVSRLPHSGTKNQKAMIKGDRRSISIAAASIIAKVKRDGIMKQLSVEYPGYNFSTNKGYGTKSHQTAIRKKGFSKIHRKSFNLGYLYNKI